jgi:hypothetical protein
MAMLITRHGTTLPIREPLTLDAMQRLVDGHIEILVLGGPPERRRVLISDGQGMVKQKPINFAATRLYRGEPARHRGVIVGDAIVAVLCNAGHDHETFE